MSIWLQLLMPLVKLKRKSSDYRNSQNYHHNDNDDSIAQGTTITTATNSDSQNAGRNNNKIQIITDDPAEEDALYFQGYSENLANIIKGTRPKFAVGIFGKWGTGKTTLMRMIKRELDKDNEKVLTVWFDAWRYEKEKYLAVIPFLRQIRIALEKDLAKHEKGKSSRWEILRNGLEKTFAAFIISTEFSVSPAGSPVSTSTNLEKFYDSLKSKGSVFIDGERREFQEHSTDYLQAALDKLKDARIVVFVDDLDRCTPQNALEVIESIKTFFDINGIVYVIGMDSESINHIIKQKYEEGSNIDGLKYLQKIVQLPFQIPVWKPQDILESISKIISKGLEGSELVEEFQKDKRKLLIVKAVEPNPRQVKRFVNNIILARAVFGKDVDIDKLIAVQALNFRREWNRFLEVISENDTTRKTFFEEYYIPPKGKGKSIRNKDSLDSFVKEQSDANRPLPKEIIDIFQELIINQKDGSLKSFLDDADADEILRDIKEMEDYRRALEATNPEEQLLTGKSSPTDEQLLELLNSGGVEEFNKFRKQNPLIRPSLSRANLQGADLSGADLSNAKLSYSKLSKARLIRADLSGADLSGADLPRAALPEADLSNAKLFHADLSNAKLFEADLSEADLSEADLSRAIFFRANLQGADLSEAKLSEADLSRANLSNANLQGADLSRANLQGADLSNANLSRANLSNANLSGADLSRANLSNANLSGADLSRANLQGAVLHYSIIIGVKYDVNNLICPGADFKYATIDDEQLSKKLMEGEAENVSPAARSKKKLREVLALSRSPSFIEDVLSLSRLPE